MKNNKHYLIGFGFALLSLVCVHIGSGNPLFGLAVFWGILALGHFMKSAAKK